MKVISSKMHGVLDYLVGIILIMSPWIFGFADGGREMSIPIILGILSVVYSLLTRYEFGVYKVIPFKAHLMVDALSGVLLAASPWIFNFASDVYLPHLLFGLMEIIVVFLTNRQTETLYPTLQHSHAV